MFFFSRFFFVGSMRPRESFRQTDIKNYYYFLFLCSKKIKSRSYKLSQMALSANLPDTVRRKVIRQLKDQLSTSCVYSGNVWEKRNEPQG